LSNFGVIECRAQAGSTGKIRIPGLLFVVMGLILALSARDAQASRILVIHSYHQGLAWTEGFQNGFSRIFAQAGADFDLDIHYLDMARLGMEAGKEQAEKSFVEHMTSVPHGSAYDLVLLSDNDALDTVLRHRQTIAPDVPVVFCGINNFSHGMLKGQAGVTGVAETPSFTKTLELASTLFPGLRKVLVLGEDTDTGRQNLAILEFQLRSVPSRLHFEVIQETDIHALERRLARLTPEWAVLPMCRPFDGSRLLSVSEASSRLSAAAPVPVLASWDFGLGHGSLGGVVVSSLSQGEAAAALALRIVNGESADTIPVVEDSPNLVLLDQQVLERFHVADRTLPANVLLLNHQSSFYEQYRSLVWSYGLLSLVGTMLSLLLAINIIRRRRAEASLKRQLLFTETMLRAMPTPVFYKDNSGRYLGCNQAFADFHGLPEADFIGKTVEEVFPELDAELFQAKDQEILNHGGVQRYEHSIVTPRGERKITIHKALFFDDKSLPAGIIGVLTDVTEQCQAEERLALAIAGSNDGIWDWDRVSRTVYFSPRWKEILGYADHELANDLKEWKSRIHPEDLNRVLAANDHFLNHAESHFVVEYRLRHKDGTYRWVLGRGTCLRDRDGVPYRMAGSHADITERKRMELELVDARDAALAASEAKSAFLANMSHEIRTPLNGIMSMLQLLDTLALTEEQKTYVRMATVSTKRLTGLLSDILDISRIEAGKLVIMERPFELAELKSSIEGLFSSPAREKGIHLELALEPGLPDWLVGDDSRLRQILFNLVGNSIKFTTEGFVRLEVSRLAGGGENQHRLLFCVSDSGPGISDELLNEIFEPFVQGEGSYVRHHQGAGLGLAIVNRLVRMMGASLSIDSADTGTTICFSMLFKVARGVEGTAEDTEIQGQPDRKALRILLVEDDAVSMFAARRVLEKSGHAVTPASDGAQALELLRAAEFDIILMDVQMPIMDGTEATAAIRNDPSLGPKVHIPIIAMTAYAMTGDREKFLAAGMDGYIAKPMDRNSLCLAIESVLSDDRIVRNETGALAPEE